MEDDETSHKLGGSGEGEPNERGVERGREDCEC